jgi:hypothetical protein
MKNDRAAGHSRHTWLCYGICLICAVLIKPVQDRVESRLGKYRQEPDLLFFSSPDLIKKMALGYDSLLADIYWMRTIQYYGNRDAADKRPLRYKNLATLLDITTTLDPNLLDAFRSGSLFLAEADPIGAGQPQEGLKLLDKGISTHPEEWQLYYDKGFIYYMNLQDYKAAGEVWLSGSRLPEAPVWMQNLAAMSLSKGGAVEIAIGLWRRQYEESDRESVKENARNHLLSFQVAGDLWTLEAMISRYQEKTGSLPQNLKELVRGKSRKYATIDPLGTPYQYDPKTGKVSLSPETKIRFLKVPEIYKKQLTIDD